MSNDDYDYTCWECRPGEYCWECLTDVPLDYPDMTLKIKPLHNAINKAIELTEQQIKDGKCHSLKKLLKRKQK